MMESDIKGEGRAGEVEASSTLPSLFVRPNFGSEAMLVVCCAGTKKTHLARRVAG